MSRNQNEMDIMLERARGWCSRREMCRSEVKTRLLKTDLGEDEINQVLIELIKEKFIDETRFAKAFVHDKIAFQKWGIQKIKQALYYKGISQDNINEALEDINKEEYLEKFLAVAKAKRRTIKSETEYEKNQKLVRFLLSKGVNTDDVFKIIRKINE